MRIPFFKLLLSAMMLSATMSSCIVYHAPTTSLPLLAENGEKQLEASLSASAPLGLAPALNVSFAYAPTDLLCTQAAVSFTNEKAFQAQLQAGIYKNFQPAVLEWYVGYAYGTSYSGKSSDLNKNNFYYDGYYQIPFTQLNFGFRKLLHGFVDLGVGFKGGLMLPHWDKVLIADDGTLSPEYTFNSPLGLFEPQLMLRFGFQQVKLTLSLAYSHLSGIEYGNTPFTYEPIGIGLGVNWSF